MSNLYLVTHITQGSRELFESHDQTVIIPLEMVSPEPCERGIGYLMGKNTWKVVPFPISL